MFVLVILSAMIASVYTFYKILLEFFPPISIIALRLLLSGIFFLLYHKYTKATIPAVIRSDYWLYFQITAFSFYIPYILECWALRYMTSSKTAFLYSVSPVITAFLSFIFFHEKMTYKKGLGLLLSIVAVIPVLVASAPREGGAVAFISLPEIAVLIAMLSLAYGWIVMRKAVKSRSFPIIFVNGIGMFVAGSVAAITTYFLEFNTVLTNIRTIPINSWFVIAASAMGLILIGSIGAYLLYGYLLRYYTATLLTFGVQLTPLFATLYGFFLLHERISYTFFFSMTCLVIGILIVYREELRQGYFDVT